MKLKSLYESESDESRIKRLRDSVTIPSSKNIYNDMIGVSERLAIVGQYLSDWGFPVDPVSKPSTGHPPFIRVWNNEHKTGVVAISVRALVSGYKVFGIPTIGPSEVFIEKLGSNMRRKSANLWAKKVDLAKPNALQTIKQIVEEMVFLPNQRRDHLVDPDES